MNFKKEARIGVLLGGLSKEREISIRTGHALAQGLRNLGYSYISEIDVNYNLANVLTQEKIEVAVIALHGRYGEDGTVQGLLEFLQIPYTGTGILGSAIAMDKVTAKKLFKVCGVCTPDWLESDQTTDLSKLRRDVVQNLGLPVVAKPSNEGSTIGLSIVRDESEIKKAHENALVFDDVVVWEKFIKGIELTIGFLKNEPLPLVEIVPKKGLFDYEAKYTKGMTDYFCPARVSDGVAKIVQEEARKAFYAVNADSFGRVDSIFAQDRSWVLEVNTIPGMTETSLLPKAVRASGRTFEDMAEEILQDARLKQERGRQR